MAKYSLDFKLNVINFYLEGNGFLSTAKHFSIDGSQVRRWCSAYQLHGIEGIKPRKSKAIYSLELKMHILSYMVNISREVYTLLRNQSRQINSTQITT